jgi:DNA polymerase-3 subunit alpha
MNILDKEPVKGYTSGMIQDILPCFTTHYSFSSILTLEEAGKTEPGNAVSVCDIAKANGLKQVTLIEDRVDGFIEAYKNLSKIGVQLVYGLRFVVVPDINDKTEQSKRLESRIIVLVKDTQGYNDVVRLWSRAWVDGFYTPARESGYGRLDWKMIREFWTDNLSMALPWASSFLAENTLTFVSLVPELPIPTNEVFLFKEIDSGLPFADLIDVTIDRFAADTGARIQPVKSVYYEKRADFMAYVVYRAILNKGEFSKPNVDNLASDHFSFEDWKRLTKEVTP